MIDPLENFPESGSTLRWDVAEYHASKPEQSKLRYRRSSTRSAEMALLIRVTFARPLLIWLEFLFGQTENPFLWNEGIALCDASIRVFG
jgi:hypothetical protein